MYVARMATRGPSVDSSHTQVIPLRSFRARAGRRAPNAALAACTLEPSRAFKHEEIGGRSDRSFQSPPPRMDRGFVRRSRCQIRPSRRFRAAVSREDSLHPRPSAYALAALHERLRALVTTPFEHGSTDHWHRPNDPAPSVMYVRRLRLTGITRTPRSFPDPPPPRATREDGGARETTPRDPPFLRSKAGRRVSLVIYEGATALRMPRIQHVTSTNATSNHVG
jgi:hypothetical protein